MKEQRSSKIVQKGNKLSIKKYFYKLIKGDKFVKQ